MAGEGNELSGEWRINTYTQSRYSAGDCDERTNANSGKLIIVTRNRAPGEKALPFDSSTLS